MNQFLRAFEENCAKLNVEPIKTVLDIAKDRKNEKVQHLIETLNLSGLSIPAKTLSALSQALATDDFFTRIVLADAFLGDDGCIKVANALKTNSKIEYMDLRGNGIRSDGAIALGQMLRVNSTLKSLNLEWNCVGIWETGIRALADALSMNQSLTTLDLRNNKLGPHGVQSLALSLKHNTTLISLDLRWNNAGLIGGRAFVDLLKWNVSLKDLDLTGNEIPEDVSRALFSGLERNKERYRHELAAKSHSETLNATLASLSVSHHDALAKLQAKMAVTDQKALTLSEKLEKATSEICSTQDCLKSTQDRLEKVASSKKELEDLLTRERTNFQSQVAQLTQELVSERERHIKLQDIHHQYVNEYGGKALELDSIVKQKEVEIQVLKNDKKQLLDELSAYKEKEKTINQLWEEKLQRLEAKSQGKLETLHDSLEKEFLQKLKKVEGKNRSIEQEKIVLEEEFDAFKQKVLQDKHAWQEQLSQQQTKVRQEEALKREDLEKQIKQLQQQKEALQQQLANNAAEQHNSLKSSELEIKRLHESINDLQKLNSGLVAKQSYHDSDLKETISRLEQANKSNAQLSSLIETLKNELERKSLELQKEQKNRETEIEKYQKMADNNTLLINNLKQELEDREVELETIDQENNLRQLKQNLLNDVRQKYMEIINQMPLNILEMKLSDIQEPKTPATRITRSQSRRNTQMSKFESLPQTPSARRQKRGETLYSVNGNASEPRRVTLRKESNVMELNLLKEASMVVPIGDLVVDLDPGVTVDDIKRNLNKDEVLQLQESLLRFREQTDALLAQFGV